MDSELKTIRGRGSVSAIRKREEREFEHEFIYRSCCLEMDKRVLEFFCKFSIILLAMSMSIYGVLNTEEHTEVYFSIITSIMALLVPAPSINFKKKKSDVELK